MWGLAISAGIAAIFLTIGILAMLKGSIGQTVKGVLGIIPVGNPTLWAVVFVIIGLAAGGVTGITGFVSGAFTGVGTASGIGAPAANTVGVQGLDCVFAQVAGGTASSAGITAQADNNNLKHYSVTVTASNFSEAIMANMTCTRAGDVSRGAYATCQAQASSFRSGTSTTDSNTYYIVATSTAKSKVSGYTWAQSVYLQDNAGANTASDKELTQIAFAQDSVRHTLGAYLTLPGVTVGGYLLNQTSNDVQIVCDGKTQGTLTITKVA